MKTIIISATVLTLTVVSFSGCSPAANSNMNSNMNTNRATANNSSSSIGSAINSAANTVSNTAAGITTPSADDFMKTAARGGMAEVELGKIAASKAQNAEVKKFGQMMAVDHGKANAELKALAAKKNITLPPDMGSHQDTIDELKTMTGADFDKAYVEAMVDDHETDVNAFQKQADNAADADVKAFAAKTLPVLKMHLEMIKGIHAKMK